MDFYMHMNIFFMVQLIAGYNKNGMLNKKWLNTETGIKQRYVGFNIFTN